MTKPALLLCKDSLSILFEMHRWQTAGRIWQICLVHIMGTFVARRCIKCQLSCKDVDRNPFYSWTSRPFARSRMIQLVEPQCLATHLPPTPSPTALPYCPPAPSPARPQAHVHCPLGCQCTSDNHDPDHLLPVRKIKIILDLWVTNEVYHFRQPCESTIASTTGDH